MLYFGSDGRAVAQEDTAAVESDAIDPIVTEESLPEAPGECNLRTIAAYHAAGFEPMTALPETQLFCGLAPRWGGEIDIPITHGAGAGGRYGVGDVAVTVKYEMREQSSLVPAFVIGLETMFPSGNPNWGTGENGVEVQPFLAVFKQAGGLTFQGNVGIGIRHGGHEREYVTTYNGAAALPVRHTRFALLGEINGAYSPLGTKELSFSPGLHYSLGKDRYVGFALPIRIEGASPRIGAILQFQMRVRGERDSQ